MTSIFSNVPELCGSGFFFLFLDLYLHVCHALYTFTSMEQNIPSLIMCLTYMNCMTFDNKQFTDLKKNGFCGTEVHYTFKVMFFIIKVFD